MRADWIPAALRPTRAPWAVRPAIWALLAAGLVAGVGVTTGHRVATGLAYFGVACAAVFVTSGAYRTRALSLLSQGAGAATGIVLGVAAADASAPVKVIVAAAVAMVSGTIGAIGRLTTAGALMAVIGVGFGEFARVRLPGWEQGSWYLVGSAVVAAFALAGWPRYRDNAGWKAVGTVFDRAADVHPFPDRGQASQYRLDLAAASETARTEVFDHRINARFQFRDRGQKLSEAASRAESVGFAAAEAFTSGRAPAATVIAEWRQAAIDCRAHRVPTVSTASTSITGPRSIRPVARRVRAALRMMSTRDALLAGLRLAVCIAIATAVTCALHHESHSFWLPLTVAVAVRPEYASVFVRTVNRVAGTVVGALFAAAVIAAFGSGWPVAIAAALSLAFAVAALPKLYGLAVVGVTCSALLSSCIAVADPLNPAVRLLDTTLGCAIAIVFGYLIWPGRAGTPATLAAPASAITSYLRLAVTRPSERSNWVATRDRAYQLAHQCRRDAQAALLEPGPAHEYAADALPRALTLEALVDEVTAIANRVDAGTPPPTDEELTELTSRINAVVAPTTTVAH